jgi:hypothetical protein
MMNTKILMTSTSLILAAAGIFALFAPDTLLTRLKIPLADSPLVLVQLMGALYFSFALMNWTAKDSAIGGIYARPVSLGNFSHFLSGALLLAKYQLSHEFSLPGFLALAIYAVFASLFYWLVFRATGIVVSKSAE